MKKNLQVFLGKIIGSVDGGGNETPFDEEEYVAPQDGYDLKLTVDVNIQSIVEKNLEKAVEENIADFGMCVVMEPQTGKILAMATAPDYDPNNPFVINNDTLKNEWDSFSASEKSKYLNEMWKNNCVSSVYEPGSTFKVVAASTALEEGITDTETNKYSCIGYMNVVGWRVKCWRYPGSHGTQSLRKAIINSCNPALMQIGLSIGVDKFCEYLEAYGLYSTTGVDSPGEASPIAYTKANMGELDLATTSFGQNISVSILHMATIYSTIANGGYLMKPYIVEEVKSSDGTVISKTEPVVKRQVISSKTSNEMMSVLYDTVNTGTSKAAQATGYKIAGKTGTAEEGRGNNTKFMASFAGIAPYDNPKMVIIVSIYNPTSEAGHMGGTVAAPVGGTIIEETLAYMGVDPYYSEEETSDEVVVPDLANMTYAKAKTVLKELDLYIESDQELKDDDVILEQIPKKGSTLLPYGTVRVYNDTKAVKQTTTVPNVRTAGESYATYLLDKAGLNIKVVGQGEAIIQYPSAGEVITKGSIVTVKFVDTTDLH